MHSCYNVKLPTKCHHVNYVCTVLANNRKTAALCVCGFTRTAHGQATARNKINLRVRRTRWAKTNQQSPNTHTYNRLHVQLFSLETMTMATRTFCTTTNCMEWTLDCKSHSYVMSYCVRYSHVTYWPSQLQELYMGRDSIYSYA